MSIEQQQGDDERRMAEEEAALAESLKVAAYADYHQKRGTGTWRDWEHQEKRDDGALYLGNYHHG